MLCFLYGPGEPGRYVAQSFAAHIALYFQSIIYPVHAMAASNKLPLEDPKSTIAPDQYSAIRDWFSMWQNLVKSISFLSAGVIGFSVTILQLQKKESVIDFGLSWTILGGSFLLSVISIAFGYVWFDGLSRNYLKPINDRIRATRLSHRALDFCGRISVWLAILSFLMFFAGSWCALREILQ